MSPQSLGVVLQNGARPLPATLIPKSLEERFADVEPYWMSLSRQEQQDLCVLDLVFLHERAQSLSRHGMITSPGSMS